MHRGDRRNVKKNCCHKSLKKSCETNQNYSHTPRMVRPLIRDAPFDIWGRGGGVENLKK